MSEEKKEKSVWTRTVIWFYGNRKPFFYEHKWPVLIFFAIIAFLLGFLGFSEVYPASINPESYLYHSAVSLP